MANSSMAAPTIRNAAIHEISEHQIKSLLQYISDKKDPREQSRGSFYMRHLISQGLNLLLFQLRRQVLQSVGEGLLKGGMRTHGKQQLSGRHAVCDGLADL